MYPAGDHRNNLTWMASWMARTVSSILFSSVLGFADITASYNDRQSVAWACFNSGPVFRIGSPVMISVSVALANEARSIASSAA